MKLNWGHYTVITFSAFVLLILFMVFKSYQHKNDLVAEDYYARELKFQDVIDGKARAASLPEDITWLADEGGIHFKYPALEAPVQGEINLVRPSDQNLDQRIKIEPGSDNLQHISSASLTGGKYLVQVTWTSGAGQYYTEGVVFINK